ncbi:hypothetical protein CCACVL1_26879 [Corchorus capsularis]|uniref:Uncharacterized protein n=1 Tax=Corchorus capsularis TaxID=210143 RepID=A0A1R3GCU8_COCAP|nr:hypothetical protein CCACVL1_26879 [Corchorus capsularis]
MGKSSFDCFCGEIESVRIPSVNLSLSVDA